MIFLDIHICEQRRSYRAGFSTEDQAVAFVTARRTTHAVSEDQAHPVPREWSTLIEALYPTCEHGMSLVSCYGPDHFMSAEQERAMGWAYAD